MSKDDDKTKSLARSKKSVTSLSELIGKETLNALVPGGRIVYRVGEILLGHAKAFYSDRKDARIESFHKSLLEGRSEKDCKSLLNKTFSLEDYYTLLSNAVQDDEEAKVVIYSKIFKAIITKSIPEKYKLHFIKSVREFTCYDIKLIREIYIRAKYEFIGERGRFYQVQEITETDDPIRNFSIQTLIRLGLLITKEVDLGVIKAKGLMPTDILEVLASILFNPKELTAKSLGKEAWKKIPIIFITVGDITKNQKVLNILGHSLRKLNIKHAITVPVTQQQNLLTYSSSEIIILCLDKEKNMTENSMTVFVRHLLIKEKKFVKILLSKLPDGKPYDPIPDINSLAKFNFTSKDKYEINKFEEFMKIETKGLE